MNNMISTLVIIFFGLVIVGLSFTIRNLLEKVELYEEDILIKDEFISKFQKVVEESDRTLKTLDEKGHFESDDEIGYFFKVVKDLNFSLGVYFKNYEKDK